MNLRYLIVLKASTTESGRKTTFDMNDGVWGVGRESDRFTFIAAEILDIKEVRQSGSLNAHASGKAGFMVPFVLIIPLPPFPYSAMTESHACSSLGKAVAQFISDDGP